MKITFIIPAVFLVALLPACDKGRGPEIAGSLPAEPLPLMRITVENHTGAKIEGIDIRSEAFYFQLPAIETGQAVVKVVPRVGEGCGVAVDFTSGGHKASVGSALFSSDDRLTEEIRLELKDAQSMAVSYRLKGETEFRTW